MRPSNLENSRGLLEGLRRGEVSFDEAAAGVRTALSLRAERFIRLWRWSGQEGVAPEDLVQDMLVALWRAVDRWDPTRADLVVYVDAQLGRACQRRLRKEAGYPDPRRRAPVRRAAGKEAEDALADRGLLVPNAEAELDARRRARALLVDLVGLERHVVSLVLEGQSLEETTRTIYRDRSARIEYQMDSMGHARRLVGVALRRATSVAETALV
jgi:DNA-directed RNA polymerase specialized sigma24 family protein